MEQPVAVERMALKTCTKCHAAKWLGEFYKCTPNKDGLHSWCKECVLKKDKARNEKNRARETIIIPEFKTCPRCKIKKPSCEFSKCKRNANGLQPQCKECSANDKRERQEKNRARKTVSIPETKTCPGCALKKPSGEFGKCKSREDGLQRRCRACTIVYKRGLMYGLSDEQFEAILEAQGGACPICTIKFAKDNPPCVDHDHLTGENRGLLCHTCNRALGYFRDNIIFLERAVIYLNSPTTGIVYKRKLDKEIKNKILADQGGSCKICFEDLHNKKACSDHCHLTGFVRGCLCNNCNCGLGFLKDSIEKLNNSIKYLKKHLETRGV